MFLDRRTLAGVLATAHKLSLGIAFRSLHTLRVQTVGRSRPLAFSLCLIASLFASQTLAQYDNNISAIGDAGRGLTSGIGYSDIKFLGENIRSHSITICMDISPSMIAKGVAEDARNESMNMLTNMSFSTKFNIIVFYDGALPFAPQMVYATKENKEAALTWLKQPFDGRRQGNLQGYSGSTPYMAIRMAVEMGSDTIFILTCDHPHLKKGVSGNIPTHMEDIEKYVRAIETTTGKSVRFYPILYKPFDNDRGKQAIDYYKGIARATGGRCKVIPRAP